MENTLYIDEAQHKIADLEYLPAPSPIIARLLATITDNHCTFEDISSIIEADAAVTSQLLKIANSAFYGFRRTIQDLERAVMLIGIREVRNLCLAICLVHQFRPNLLPNGFDLYNFWTHNLMTSFCCKELARDHTWITEEEIYLMGLLHDLGRLVTASTMPDKFNSIVLLSRKKNLPISRAEEIYGLPHTEIGAWLAVKWNFSEALKAVLEYHHEPACSTRYSRECAIVQTATYVARRLQAAHSNQDVELPFPKTLMLAGIDFNELEILVKKAEKLEEEVCQMASVLVGS